ncbi:hypothetical protein EON65_02205 [archaeon]|nr:MAG: hypothetical protein EON65_02205 [archaeon]
MDEAAETLKRWLTYTILYIREFCKGVEPDSKQASDSKYLQYLLSARMSKGTALETGEGVAQHEELSGRARYEFAAESFPFPIVVAGYSVDQVDANNVSQMKSMRELQGRLRSLCLEVGAALVFTSFEQEASSVQLRRYILHRLYPEHITMELRINDKIHNTFIPSGFDTPDLISLSSGVKVEKDAVSGFVSSAEKRVADWANELKERQQRVVPTIAPYTTIESEEDWLQSLHGFISKCKYLLQYISSSQSRWLCVVFMI